MQFANRLGASNPLDGFDVGASSAASLVDLDGDGDLDAVAGELYGTFAYFENTGTDESAAFVQRTGPQNPLDGLQVGTAPFTYFGRSTPAFVDIDGDGDLDAFAGEYYGTFAYFENIGSAVDPAFVQRTGATNPLDGLSAADVYSTLAFADLDGDGDFDAAAGSLDGSFAYFENTGTAMSPAFVERTAGANPLTAFDVGGNSTPAFTDLDFDGDLDLVSGNADGTFAFFENVGTAASPLFVERTGIENPFAAIDVGSESTPTLGDLDGDGDADLVAGTSGGGFAFLENLDPEAPPEPPPVLPVPTGWAPLGGALALLAAARRLLAGGSRRRSARHGGGGPA